MPPADRIHELLPWFVAGTLDPAETESFRAHLPTCRACREEMAVLQALRAEVDQHGEDFFRDHPPADRLVAAVRGDLHEDLDDAEAALVRRHLALCSTCAAEARWATGKSVAGASSTPAPAVPASGKAPASRPWVWALVAAAAVLAVMLPWGLRDRTGQGATGIPPAFFVTATERGAGEANAFAVDREAPVVAFWFEIDLPASSFPISVELRDTAGKIVTRRAGIHPNGLISQTYVTVTCARNDCPDGSYAGVVRPAPASGDAVIEYPFRLRTE